MAIYHLIWPYVVGLITAQLCVTVSSTAKQLTCFDTGEQARIFGGNTQMGPPGKMGPPGAKGDPGRNGSVDYRVLESMIEKLVSAKMEKRLADVEASLKEMGLNLTILKQQVDLIPKYQGRCDLRHSNICYWAFVHDVQDVRYRDAESLCEQDGGFPASIKSLQHNVVLDHYMKHAKKAFVWTGMTANQLGNVQSVRKPGDPVYPTAIRHYYVSRPAEKSRIRLRISPNNSDYRYRYFMAVSPEYSFHGVICEEP